MFNGRMKALTFSYDDGVAQDIRLIRLFDKYGMKATFNLNSGTFGTEQRLLHYGCLGGRLVEYNKVRAQDVKYIYEGHEVAVHTMHHANLKDLPHDVSIKMEVEQDRLQLSELCGYEVVGMAYPGGSLCYDKRAVEIVRNQTGIKYARGTTSTYSFDMPADLIDFSQTCMHCEPQLFDLGKKFLELKPDKPQLFYVYGHAYEFDAEDNWKRFEEFLEMMSRRDDICYCTNRQALLGY